MNQRGIHIPHLIILCRFFGGCAKHLSGISRKTGLTRGHGNQIFHTVSPMNIHPLADRTQTVSRIRIPRMLLTVKLYPVIVIPTRLFICKIMLAQVMDVCPLGMSDLSQHPLLHHVQCSQGKRIVTTVLQHHAVTAGFFGCIHQTPAIGHTHGGRNLQSDMASLLQSINRNLGMSQPVCTNINKIYLFTFAHPAPHPLFRIVLSFGAAGLLQNPLCTLYVFLPQITKRFHLNAFQVHISLECKNAPVS